MATANHNNKRERAMLITSNSNTGNSRPAARRRLLALAAAAGLLISGAAIAQGTSATEPSAATAAEPEHAAGRILVMPRAGLPDAALGQLLREQGAGRWKKIGRSPLRLVELPPGLERAMVNRLARHPHIKFAELDRRVAPAAAPNDPYYGSAWHLAKINAATAWDSSTGSGVTIAILDSGVDASHPDLATRIVAGYNFYDGNTNTADVQGHGTAVAGAAAATLNNGVGVAAVAGGARIMPVRISDTTGYAWWSTVAQGLVWAADQGARVANISYGGVAASSSVQSAAEYMKSMGGLVFAAAGNNNRDENIVPTTSMISVSATEENDLKASFSSWGNFVAVSAPGNNIWTTSRGGIYQQWWGTSIASPVTAGVAALMMARAPSLTGAQIESLLYSSSVDLGAAGRDPVFGYGRVNAAAAVAAAGAAVSPDSQAPTATITAPAASSTVAGIVAVNLTASDNIGVTKVELRINGTTVATDTSTPYGFSWDSATVANGAASLVVVAFDAAGNSKASTAVAVNVANADTTLPTASITSPGAGASVSGVVPISVSAADNIGVTKIELRINGTTVATDTASPFAFNWDSTALANGAASLVAVAFDAAGNNRASTAVAVTVANADTTLPTVSITSPGTGASVSGVVPISVSAADNIGVTKVELRINGTTVATDTASPFAFNWDSSTLANGAASLVAVAFDAAGNNRASTAVAVTVANADTTLPTVSITSPGAGASVSGVVPISVSAADNIGVTKVELRINGTTVATDTASPFAFNWDSTALANGAASLVAVAFDAAGNNRASTAVAVTVANADTTLPTVSITSPGAGASVSGVVPISVSAADNIGVTKVELRINGTTVATDTASPFAFNWDSSTLANGAASLVAVAFDAAGNNRASTAVAVTVANADTTLPTVSITSPGAGASVSGVVPISVSAADNIGVTKVELRVNGMTVATDTASPFAFNWDSSTLANGAASLVAVAFDAAGNAQASAAVAVTVANGPPPDTQPPVISFTNPVNGATITGIVSVRITATDNGPASGISQSLYINNKLAASATGGSLTYNWNARRLTPGTTQVLRAEARDAAGNVSTASVTVNR